MSRQAEALHVTMGAPTSHMTYLPRNKTTRTDYGTRGPKYKGHNHRKQKLQITVMNLMGNYTVGEKYRMILFSLVQVQVKRTKLMLWTKA